MSDCWTILLQDVPVDDEPFDPADLAGDDSEPSVPHQLVVRRFRDRRQTSVRDKAYRQ
jgi:hypothetical protein